MDWTRFCLEDESFFLIFFGLMKEILNELGFEKSYDTAIYR